MVNQFDAEIFGKSAVAPVCAGRDHGASPGEKRWALLPGPFRRMENEKRAGARRGVGG
jgi:hypothetical protein